MKKIILRFSLILIISILGLRVFKQEKVLNNELLTNNLDSMVGVYLEDENGEYISSSDIPQKDGGYTFNHAVCENDVEVTWDEEHWTLLGPSNAINFKCNLYFEKENISVKDTILANNEINEGNPNFNQVATTDEGIYSISDDIYGGISYYYRGAVNNNYLKFGNYCWRIIRINGDDSIRLIYDGTSCHANGTVTTDNVILTNALYNNSSSASYYVGWTYNGTQHTLGGSNSNAKTLVENWYNNNLSSYIDKIDTGKFCNDRNVGGFPPTWDTGYNTTFHYTAYTKINGSPSLSCPVEDTYQLQIGLITADEVMLAGGIWSKNDSTSATNRNYYLYNGQAYWTMSPFQWYWSDSGDYGWSEVNYIQINGGIGSKEVSAGQIAIRPVINLKADVQISSGTGTAFDPYVIN